MNDKFDTRQEVVERKRGYHWSVSVQLGSSSQRVKAKLGGNEETVVDSRQAITGTLAELGNQVKKTHDQLLEEENDGS